MQGYQIQIAGQTFNLLGKKEAIKMQLKGMYSSEEIQSATWKKLSESQIEEIWKPKSKPLTKEQMIQNLLATGKHTSQSARAAIEYLFAVQEGDNVQYFKELIAKDAGIF
jgi:hypothetical protein